MDRKKDNFTNIYNVMVDETYQANNNLNANVFDDDDDEDDDEIVEDYDDEIIVDDLINAQNAEAIRSNLILDCSTINQTNTSLTNDGKVLFSPDSEEIGSELLSINNEECQLAQQQLTLMQERIKNFQAILNHMKCQLKESNRQNNDFLKKLATINDELAEMNLFESSYEGQMMDNYSDIMADYGSVGGGGGPGGVSGEQSSFSSVQSLMKNY